MSEQQDWAPEPWVFKPENWLEGDDQNENEIIAADGTCVTSDMQFYPHIHTESMERIAACVSACAGVPTEVLLHPNFGMMTRMVAEIAFTGHKAKEAPDDSGRTPAGD